MDAANITRARQRAKETSILWGCQIDCQKSVTRNIIKEVEVYVFPHFFKDGFVYLVQDVFLYNGVYDIKENSTTLNVKVSSSVKNIITLIWCIRSRCPKGCFGFFGNGFFRT